MMATVSPSPNSPPSAVSSPSISPPPPSSTSSLPHPSFTPPPPPTSPPSLSNANPQDPKTPSNPSSPPPQSPPPVKPPPPPITSTSLPSSDSDPSSNSHSPPPPPPLSHPPPQTSPSDPPPPPQLNPPTSLPPSSTEPPPPSLTPPPQSSSPAPPPPSTQLPINAPPPPASVPRQASIPLQSSPPPPASVATTAINVPPLPRIAPPNPPDSQPPPALSPPSVIRLSPPPPSLVSPPCSNSIGSGGSTTGGMVAIGVAVGIIVLGLIGLSVWWKRKPRKDICGLNGVYVAPSSLGCFPISNLTFTKTQLAASPSGSGYSSGVISLPSEPSGLGNSRPLFAFEELVKATNGFSPENLLGEGGFGSVYKGYLPDGRDVAVKQLKIGGGQGDREFKAEVEIISRIHHRHLVSLVGYCIFEARRLLVYDYVPNNTLHFHLHGKGRPVLNWATRVRVAAGAARGIAYLHEDCRPRIIHRDIKSSNILLDNNFKAKVSDFGLAKLALDTNTHVTTRVMGTFGYMAPEYALSGKLTEKSDVYSFGVVLLELITGRKPVDASQPLGEESLVQWNIMKRKALSVERINFCAEPVFDLPADPHSTISHEKPTFSFQARPLLSHALENEEFESLADPRLGKNYIESEMFRMIEAAAACVRHSAAKRPRMGQVLRAFDGLGSADLTKGMRVGENEVFYSAQESEEIRMFQRMSFGSESYSTDFFSQGSFDS